MEEPQKYTKWKKLDSTDHVLMQIGTKFLYGMMKMFWKVDWWWLHNSSILPLNIINFF